MPQTRFDSCVDFVLRQETEYNSKGEAICEHDPNDPGGDTKYGIDQRSHPDVDICGLTRDQAKQIYYDDEWTECRCDQLPIGWDLAVFDAAVNLGKGWAIPALQKILKVGSDGIIGPATLRALQQATETDLYAYLKARETHYLALNPRLVRRYSRGWLNRVASLRSQIETSKVA